VSPERSYRVVPVMRSLLTCPNFMQGLFENGKCWWKDWDACRAHMHLNTFAPEPKIR